MVNYEQRRGGQGNSSLSIHHSSFIILTSPLALQNALQRLPGLAEAIKAGDEERQALEAGQRARLPNDDRDPSAAKQQGQKRSQAAETRLAGLGKQLVKKIHALVLSYQPSAISYQLSAISYQFSAIVTSCQWSVVGSRRSILPVLY